MDVVPREAALFGGLKKAIKKVTKTVKNVAKSPVGKAAMLYFAPMAFGQSAPGLAGYQGLFSKASPAFSNLFKVVTPSLPNAFLNFFKSLTCLGK